MVRWKFRRLFDVLQSRVNDEGKKSPAWFLGFVEGLGSRKLTGHQIGALVNLLLVSEKDEIILSAPAHDMQPIPEEQLNFDFLSKLPQ